METTTASGTNTKETANKVVWTLDPSHSYLRFSARHMLIANVPGNFTQFDAKLTASDDTFRDGQIEVTVKVDSISTGDANRDNHLKSDDFFNAEKYPEIKFKSTGFQRKSGDDFELVGDLTIRDITKQVTFDVEYTGSTKDPWGNDRIAFEVSGSLNRFDFDLKWNALLETGGAVVGPKIKIEGSVQLIKQK